MNGQALDIFGQADMNHKPKHPADRQVLQARDSDQDAPCCGLLHQQDREMAIKWGTDSKIEYVEPTQVPTEDRCQRGDEPCG